MRTEDAMLEQILDLCVSMTALTRLAMRGASCPTGTACRDVLAAARRAASDGQTLGAARTSSLLPV